MKIRFLFSLRKVLYVGAISQRVMSINFPFPFLGVKFLVQ